MKKLLGASANATQLAARVGLINKGIGIIRQQQNTDIGAARWVIEAFRDNQDIEHNKLNNQLKSDYPTITENTWRDYINNSGVDLENRKLNTLNSLAKLIIAKHSTTNSNQSQIDSLENQLSKEKKEHQIAKTARQKAEQDKDQAQKERNTYQTQLTSQEQKIVQQLNSSLKLGLDKEEKSLNKAIVEIQRLIAKPPITTTLTNEVIEKQLQEAQQTITKLEKELKEQTPFGESIKEIIKIDEKLINENQTLKIELDKQTTNYKQLAEERNKLVMQQIKNINVESIVQVAPRAKKEEVKKIIEETNNYAELAEQRNKIITKYVNQDSADLQKIQQQQQQQQQQKERIILISLLTVSLLSVGGLLAKLKGIKGKK